MSYWLEQNDKGYWVRLIDPTTGEKYGELQNVHPLSACSEARGCGMHNRPSDHALRDAKLLWRDDRQILERVCKHGVGHPDADAAAYLASINRSNDNIHGCDGCCTGKPETSEGKPEFFSSMRVEITKGPRPVDVLFGGEAPNVTVIPNRVAPPFRSGEILDNGEDVKQKSHRETESDYYTWRMEHVGETLSVKDAFFAGATAERMRTANE